MSIIIHVVGQQMHASSRIDCVVAGSQQFVKFRFNLSEEWNGLTTFAQFAQNGKAYNKYLDAENSVCLPPEIKEGTCTMMLYGSKDKIIGTTNYLTLKIDKNILVSDVSSTEISESLYTQLVSKVDELIKTGLTLDLIDESVKREMASYLESGKLANMAVKVETSLRAGSDNPVSSGAVHTVFEGLRGEVRNNKNKLSFITDIDDYAFAIGDDKGNLVFAVDHDGKVMIAQSEDETESEFVLDLAQDVQELKSQTLGTKEYAYAVCDEAGNVVFAITHEGEVRYANAGTGGNTGGVVEPEGGNTGVVTTGYFNYKRCGLPVLYLQEKEAGDYQKMIAAGEEKLEKEFDYTLKTARDSTVSSGTCELKFQGSSSLRNGYPKYNFTFKVGKEMKFEAVRDDSGADRVVAWPEDSERIITGFEKPWGDQRKYCLKANFIDPSGARNVVSARLWASIVKSRANSKVVDAADTRLTASPNCGAIDGFPVVVVLNNQFNGLYTFNIPKEDWMFNGVNDEGDIKYIVGGESNSEPAAGFAKTADFPEDVAQSKTDFAIEYQPDDTTKKDVVDSFNEAISAVMAAKAQLATDPNYDWETAVSPYFDIGSAIDYYIFVCCISGVDNTRKNILYATYGTGEDGVHDKWFMSAYDLDTTFGSNPYGKGLYKVNTTRTQFKEATSYHNLFYLIYHYSHDKLMERYNELRNGTKYADGRVKEYGILSDENVWYMFNNFVNAIPKAVYNADADRWASAHTVRTMPGTTTANVENFIQYYRMHCALLDKEMEG